MFIHGVVCVGCVFLQPVKEHLFAFLSHACAKNERKLCRADCDQIQTYIDLKSSLLWIELDYESGT